MKKPLWEVSIWSILLVLIISLVLFAIGRERFIELVDDNISAIAVIIAGVATIIAVYLGYHTAHVSAVLRVAEFRQEWINALRDDLARFHAIGTTPDQNPMLERKFYELGTRIELRMNTMDPDYDRLLEIMYRHFDSADGDIFQKYQNNPEFVAVSQRILKREWERLKRDVRARNI
jgi:hypothetical protein